MNTKERLKLIEQQRRSILEGQIEDVETFGLAFVDESSDEFISLHELVGQKMEIFHQNAWMTGTVQTDLSILTLGETVYLQEGTKAKLKKPLPFSLTELLFQLPADIFIQFLTSLNNLGFSIYDCIYSHNFLSYLSKSRQKQGVNFMTFDNGEEICVVQHHFSYYMKQRDRFEFTNSTGRRLVIEKKS